MQRSDIHILVVEDDPTLSKAITASLERKGYKATLVTRGDEALSMFKINEYHAAIIDCMIPRLSGVDLSAKIRQEGEVDFPIILTSGIYKDKQFVKDALHKSKALAFLEKPFNIEEVIELIDNQFTDDLEEEKEPLLRLLLNKNPTANEFKEAVINTEYIHGNDLPLLYTTILNSKLSGVLTITDSKNIESKVHFIGGQISRVALKDDKSFFGVLLVEKGFTSFDEVQKGLNQESNKPIGERLVDDNSLSPHAIKVIQLEQNIIRISKTIYDDSLRVNFVTDDTSSADITIDPRHFIPILNDWVASKLDLGWLKSFYITWLEYPLIKGKNYAEHTLYETLPLIYPVPGIIKNAEKKTIQTFLDESSADEEDVLKALHLLLLTGVFAFSSMKEKSNDFVKKLNRLKKMFGNIEDKNYFEILGLSITTRASEISKAYHELAKALHPDKIPQGAPKEYKDYVNKVFLKINDSYKTLSKETERNHYIRTLEEGRVSEVLEAETLFEKGQQLLEVGQYKEAYNHFKNAYSIKGHRKDVVIYLVWSQIKAGNYKGSHEEFSQKMRKLLGQVPHEERHSSPYFFIRGLYYKLAGNSEKALKYFKHASSIDSGFVDAKREYVAVKKDLYDAQKKGILQGEFSTVVTKLFSKNTKSQTRTRSKSSRRKKRSS